MRFFGILLHISVAKMPPRCYNIYCMDNKIGTECFLNEQRRVFVCPLNLKIKK